MLINVASITLPRFAVGTNMKAVLESHDLTTMVYKLNNFHFTGRKKQLNDCGIL